MSKSGANPDKNPINPIMPSVFLLLTDCDRTAPSVPCVIGSNYLFPSDRKVVTHYKFFRLIIINKSIVENI